VDVASSGRLCRAGRREIGARFGSLGRGGEDGALVRLQDGQPVRADIARDGGAALTAIDSSAHRNAAPSSATSSSRAEASCRSGGYAPSSGQRGHDRSYGGQAVQAEPNSTVENDSAY
jgi:hypothetical protein